MADKKETTIKTKMIKIWKPWDIAAPDRGELPDRGDLFEVSDHRSLPLITMRYKPSIGPAEPNQYNFQRKTTRTYWDYVDNTTIASMAIDPDIYTHLPKHNLVRKKIEKYYSYKTDFESVVKTINKYKKDVKATKNKISKRLKQFNDDNYEEVLGRLAQATDNYVNLILLSYRAKFTCNTPGIRFVEITARRL